MTANHAVTAARPSQGWRARLPVLLIAALIAGVCTLAFLPLGLLFGLHAYYQSQDLIFPGVAVGESRLQGKTIQVAAVVLHKDWNIDKRIALTDGLHTWNIPAAEFGLSLDALATAGKAYAVGRDVSAFAGIGEMVYGLRHGWQIEPIIHLDEGKAQALLTNLNQSIRQPPIESSLQWEAGQLTVTPGKIGYEFNLEEAFQILHTSYASIYLSGQFRIPLKPLAPQNTDLSAILQSAQQMLNRPVTLYAYDAITDQHFQWSVPRDVLATWLAIGANEQGTTVVIAAERLATYLESLNASLGTGRYIDVGRHSQPAAEAIQKGETYTITLSHPPTRYTVNPGDTLLKIAWKLGFPYWMILQANPGLDPDRLPVGQELLIPSKDDLLPLPVVPNKRIVISISQQRLSVYQDGKRIARHPISTGIDRSPTQPGVFQVRAHIRQAYASIWDLTMPNFLAIYEAWPGFYNGIHGLPTLSNGRRLWGNILGRPASFGCIILDLKPARELYEWAEDGVVVEIQP